MKTPPFFLDLFRKKWWFTTRYEHKKKQQQQFDPVNDSKEKKLKWNVTSRESESQIGEEELKYEWSK